MTTNQDLVLFAIFKVRALDFRALGEPIDLTCSEQPHLGPPAMYPWAAGPRPHLNLHQAFSPTM